MNPALQLSLKQQLKLNPQLQQSIKLLQLSGIDLLSEIQEQLESNPLLSTKERPSTDSHDLASLSSAQQQAAEEATPSNISSCNTRSNNSLASYELENVETEPRTIAQKLEWQLELAHLSTQDKEIGYYIIENLNSRGFLNVSFNELAKQFYQDNAIEISENDIAAVATHIQKLEPLGCGSLDVQHFLNLQLSQSRDPNAKIATSIISQHFKSFCHKKHSALIKALKLKSDEFQKAMQLITSLNTHPTQGLSVAKTEYIKPDLVAYSDHGNWMCEPITKDIPSLTINQQYQELLKSSKDPNDQEYLEQKLQAARSFIHALESRHNTLHKVCSYIVHHQQDYFSRGEEYLKPLKLQDVADALELHESTISRATSNKFLQAPAGTLALKHFFSSALISKQGTELSSKSVKFKIKRFIDLESSHKPLSDNRIMQLLENNGISIARRTVSKYREAMNIPCSSQRKYTQQFTQQS